MSERPRAEQRICLGNEPLVRVKDGGVLRQLILAIAHDCQIDGRIERLGADMSARENGRIEKPAHIDQVERHSVAIDSGGRE
ncbi:MAG: hypothetical protein NVS3B5_08580 [Sphingomicrobium sp.]